jgi:FkbM family methyltransferase
MDLKEYVKQLLRMCGHAMVSTVHERLDNVDRQLERILDQNERILDQNIESAQNQTALLQSAVHLVESLPQIRSELQQMELRLASLVRDHCAAKPDLEAAAGQIERIRRELNRVFANLPAAEAQAWAAHLEGFGQRLDANAQAAHEEIELFKQRFDCALSDLAAANSSTRDSIALLEPVARETRSFLANEAVRQVCVETSEYAATNPELGLMSFLYSHLPGRKAIDIGAHIGEVSNCLLKTGFEVYAFEPYPPSYTRLSERLKDYPAFRAFNLALGATDGELPLYLVTDLSNGRSFDDPTVFHGLARHGMPEGLSFHETVQVPVKRLAELHKSGLLPDDISLVKIDTEGYDLEVIRGMEDHRYPVVSVEFWDTRIPFASDGLLYTVESMVREMARRSYPWYIVLYRVWGQNQTAFFCNHDQPVPGSWGNLFFFRDHDTFQHAQQWCAAVLPRTYFKSVPATPATTR